MEHSRRHCDLGPSHSRHLESQSAFVTKDGALDTRRHQLCFGCLLHRPYDLPDRLDTISRHFVELPSHPIPCEHGGMCRPNNIVGPGNLSVVSKARKEAELLGPSAATNGVAREIVGQPR